MLQNQFSPARLAEAACIELGLLFPEIPDAQLEEIIDVSIANTMPLIHSNVFFHTGQISIGGKEYDAIISPHYHNSSRSYDRPGYDNRYHIMLRSHEDGVVATRILDLIKEEIADLPKTILARVSDALNNRRGANGRIFYREEDLWTRQRDDKFKQRSGFRISIADEIVGALLSELSVKLPWFEKLSEKDIQGLRKKLAKHLRDDAVVQRNEAWLNFYRRLRTDVLEFMASYNEDRIDLYNYFAVRSVSEQVLDFRRGAINFSKRLKQTVHHWPPQNTKTFWDIVDTGQSVITAMAKAFALPEVVIKKMQKEFSPKPDLQPFFAERSFEGSFLIKDYKYQGYGRLFSYEPSLHWPVNEREWKDLLELCKLASYVSDSKRYYFKSYFSKKTARLVMKLWKSRRNAQSWSDFSDLFIGQHEKPEAYVKDMMLSIFHKVVLPAILRLDPSSEHIEELARNETIQNEIIQKLTKLYDIPQAIAASDYWHENRAVFVRALRQDANDTAQEQLSSWQALIDRITAPNGIVITPLTSLAALEEEGSDDAMHHCVADYSWKCLRGSSHIFSLTDNTGARLSTLELVDISESAVGGRNMVMRKNQNRGYKNSPAPSEAATAAEWLVNQINDGKIETNIEKIRIVQARVRQKTAGDHLGYLKTLVGFDFTDLATSEQVRKLYTRCLPPKLRGTIQSVDDFLRAAGIDKVLREHGLVLPARRERKLVTLRALEYRAA